MDGVEPEFERGLEATGDSTLLSAAGLFSSSSAGDCRNGPEIKRTCGERQGVAVLSQPAAWPLERRGMSTGGLESTSLLGWRSLGCR